MKHKTLRPQFLLGLFAAGIVLAGAATLSTHSGQYSAAILNSSNSAVGVFDPPRTEPGCTQWLVYQKTGPVMTFWNANGSVARTVSGTTMTTDLKLSVPAGKFIKYVAYGATGNHALNVKLTAANNAQVGGWYVFSAAKNRSPYRFDGSVDTNTATNVYFKAGHIFQQSNQFAVTYCPIVTSSSSIPSKASLSIVSETSPSTVEIATQFIHEVVVKNTGTLSASGVQLRFPVPYLNGTRFLVWNTDTLNSCSGTYTDVMTCNLRDLAPGESKTAQFKLSAADAAKFCDKTTVPLGVSVWAGNVQTVTGASVSHQVHCPYSTFNVGMNGPLSQAYAPGAQDVVFGNMTFDAAGKNVTMKDLFVAVQGTKSAYGSMNNVELRSTTTGRTFPGIIPAIGSSTWMGRSATVNPGYYTIYRFDDVPVNGQDVYEFRADLSSSLVYDSFRIHICGEGRYKLDATGPVISSTGCDFAGLVFSSTMYQMDVVESANNSPVADVRPRGTISGNFQNTLSPVLTIIGRSAPMTDVAVSNAKNVILLSFDANASNAKDIFMTNLKFYASVGSPVNANNYSLWVDTNSDNKVDNLLQAGVSSQTGIVSFDGLRNGGYIIPRSTTTRFEVHADIASSLVSNSLQLQFATGSSFISAETTDSGRPLATMHCKNPSGGTVACPAGIYNAIENSQFIVLLARNTVYTLKSQGDLFVTNSTNPIRARQLLGGKLEDEILRVQFHAEFEDIDVTDLIFSANARDANSFTSNIDSLELYKVGSVTPFAIATVGGCVGTIDVSPNSMCANLDTKQFVVAKGADQDILVRPRVKTDEQGSVSGSPFGLLVDPTPTAWSGSGAVRARGVQSSNALLKNDGDTLAEGEVFIGTNTAKPNITIQGLINRIVHSKIASVVNNSQFMPPNGSAVPYGHANIGGFRIAAGQNSNTKNGVNKVVLNKLSFIVSSQNVLLSTNNVFLRNPVGNNIQSPCVVVDGAQQNGTVTGNFYVFCDNINALTAGSIGPGEYMNLYLTMDVLNSKITAAASSLQVGMYVNPNQPPYNSFQWTDKDNVSSQSFEWVDYPEGIVYSTLYQG